MAGFEVDQVSLRFFSPAPNSVDRLEMDLLNRLLNWQKTVTVWAEVGARGLVWGLGRGLGRGAKSSMPIEAGAFLARAHLDATLACLCCSPRIYILHPSCPISPSPDEVFVSPSTILLASFHSFAALHGVFAGSTLPCART